MTAFDLAQRFVGEIHEVPGDRHHPFIQFGHMLCALSPETPDEVPWCSSFVNSIAWMLRLPRSKSAAARSWLHVGTIVHFEQDPRVGFDVVILSRGDNPALGHVGFYAGHDGTHVHILGGNQNDIVSVARFDRERIVGMRRLA